MGIQNAFKRFFLGVTLKLAKAEGDQFIDLLDKTGYSYKAVKRSNSWSITIYGHKERHED